MKRKYKTTERWGEKVRGVEGGGGGVGGVHWALSGRKI